MPDRKPKPPAAPPCNTNCSNHEMLQRIMIAVCGDDEMGTPSLGDRIEVIKEKQDTLGDRMNKVENEQSRIVMISGTVGGGIGALIGGVMTWLIDHWPFAR